MIRQEMFVNNNKDGRKYKVKMGKSRSPNLHNKDQSVKGSS
jgi:hypothetical protein